MGIRQALCFAVFVSSLSAGCNSVKSLTAFTSGGMKSDATEEDPLDRPSRTSAEYKAAKKTLHSAAPDTVVKFARWREDLGDYEEARKRYQDVLSDKPDHVDARLGVARVEMKTGRKAESLKILEATVRKYPDSKDAWLELGRLHSSQDDLEKAIISFRRSLKLAPNDQMTNYELGVALAKDNQLQESHQYLSVAGGESAAYYNIGYLLHEGGRPDEAADWVQRALNSRPDERTKASAEQLLASLDQATTRGAERSAIARRQPVINRSRTEYQRFTETSGPDGFETIASLKADRRASAAASDMAGPNGLAGTASVPPAARTTRGTTTTASWDQGRGMPAGPQTVQPVSGVREAPGTATLPQWQPGGNAQW